VGPLTDVVSGGEADTQLVEEVDVQQDAACFLVMVLVTGLLEGCVRRAFGARPHTRASTDRNA
jgi:hypothetical protein